MQGQKNMPESPIKVLVVDDSAFMRRVIISMLENDSEIDVIGYARDGQDALNKISKLKPDVITLDVEMPKMDGIETLKNIMCSNPLPVVMLSAHTRDGAHQTLQALELGAVDFVAKPEGIANMQALAGELPHKLKVAAGAEVTRKCTPLAPILEKKTDEKVISVSRPIEVVAIGTSTGGPTALQTVLTSLPHNLPVGVVVVQHMPKGFTGPLANRLNELSALEVKEAEEGDMIAPGKVLIAPAGYQMQFARKGAGVTVTLSENSPIKTLFKPSVDVMLLSLAKVYGGTCLGVILTGMGNDGTKGLKELKKLGATVLAQDKDSCVVYGMPRSAVEAGVVDKTVTLSEMGNEIVKLIKRSS